jgi:hypothetical protein
MIGFCGKLYPVFEIRVRNKYSLVADVTFLYNVEEMLDICEPHTRDKNFRRDAANRFAAYPKYAPKYFEECPIFVVDSSSYTFSQKYTFEWNARLAPYEFFKVFDPYMAFQELSIFLGAIAVPEKEIAEPSDKIKLEAKGFDNKFSFRKPKQK